MKKIIFIAGISLLSVPILTSYQVSANSVTNSNARIVSQAQESEVPFKDQALVSAIKVALNLSDSDKITTENILKLTELRTSGTGIKDLSGLEYAKNLKIITFDSEDISSLSPLSELPYLYSVGVPKCSKLTMPEILKLKHLTELDLSGLKFSQSEFDQLSAYEQMTFLVLNGCGLKDTSFMSTMKSLNILQLNDNNLTSLEGISSDNLIALTATNNQLTQVDTNNFPKIKQIVLRNNSLQTLSGLDNLSDLVILNLDNNQLKNLSIKNLSSIKTITADNNLLNEVSFNNLPTLSEVTLKNNSISKLTNWDKLPKLTKLSLTNNSQLKDVSSLVAAPSLQELSLESCNAISDFSSLSNLNSLTRLFLSYTGITNSEIMQIGKLSNIYLLSLNGNKLSNISFLEQFPHLSQLALNQNSISDISTMPDGIIFYCQNQVVKLPKTTVNEPTQLTLKDSTGNLPLLSNWIGEGKIINDDNQQLLVWSTSGDNSFDFSSESGLFTGRIQQEVS